MGCSGVLRSLETYKVRHVWSYVIYKGWKNGKGVSMSLTRGLKPPGGAVDKFKTMTGESWFTPTRKHGDLNSETQKASLMKIAALFSGWGQYNIHDDNDECFKFSLYKAEWADFPVILDLGRWRQGVGCALKCDVMSFKVKMSSSVVALKPLELPHCSQDFSQGHF